jgi:predicted amidophosphoribosyltransferase
VYTDYCPQCGEPTEEFPDGVCPSCSLANQMELDEFLDEHDRWNHLSEAQKDRAIRHAIQYAEHYTEPEEEQDR